LARTAGRLGGERVKEKYGSSFYTEIGRKGGEAVRDTHGTEFYSRIGKLGREARSRRQREEASE